VIFKKSAIHDIHYFLSTAACSFFGKGKRNVKKKTEESKNPYPV